MNESSRPMFEAREEIAEGSEVRQLICYAPDGSIIGDLSLAKYLCGKGIVPQRHKPDDENAMMGFSEEGQKWYAWSPVNPETTIAAWAPGTAIEENSALFAYDSKKYPVGYECSSLNEAKKMASDYCEIIKNPGSPEAS